MKNIFAALTFTLLCCSAFAKESVYIGSTPADATIRKYLLIPLTDSIDFIRWKMTFKDDIFQFDCSYGIGKPNTNGFIDEHKLTGVGRLSKKDHLYELRVNTRVLYVREITDNLIHFLDNSKNLLQGNGGWSYTLNLLSPVKEGRLFVAAPFIKPQKVMAFEGRTPCQPLSTQIGRGSEQCYKLKWYVVLYADSATGKPAHYLMGGTAYRETTMKKGNWKTMLHQDGRTIFILDPEKNEKAIHLLTVNNTILLFTDPDGNPLVGNEDFSFTLSRTTDRIKR